MLRTKYNLKRIAITGDLFSPQPIGFWSRLALAVWDLPSTEMMGVYEALSAMNVEFIASDRCYDQ